MFVSLCLWIHFVLAVGGSQMQVTAPSTVRAVEGSCVFIPCTVHRSVVISFWRIRPVWQWQRQQLTVASSVASHPVATAYRGRSRLVGNVEHGQCSLLLDGVRASDAGAYRFRVDEFDRGYFRSRPVTLKVISPPDPALTVTVGNWVTASCSATFHCKGSPPHISWSHPVHMFNKNERRQQLSSRAWRSVFTARFPLTAAIFNKSLNCTVTYRGGGQATSSTLVR